MAPSDVRDRLLGVDCRDHVQRRLTHAMLAEADLVVAMGLDHRACIRRVFSREAPLFHEICFQAGGGVLDLHEALPDWSGDPEASQRYMVRTVDRIWKAMPAFIARLSDWVGCTGGRAEGKRPAVRRLRPPPRRRRSPAAPRLPLSLAAYRSSMAADTGAAFLHREDQLSSPTGAPKRRTG